MIFVLILNPRLLLEHFIARLGIQITINYEDLLTLYILNGLKI